MGRVTNTLGKRPHWTASLSYDNLRHMSDWKVSTLNVNLISFPVVQYCVAFSCCFNKLENSLEHWFNHVAPSEGRPLCSASTTCNESPRIVLCLLQ